MLRPEGGPSSTRPDAHPVDTGACMLVVLAFLLLFLLPTPWNLVGFLVVIPLWILELLAWNRSMKNRRKAVGAETLIGREAAVMTAGPPRGQGRIGGGVR